MGIQRHDWRGVAIIRISRRALLSGASAFAMIPRDANAAFAIFQTASSGGGTTGGQQNVPIGGIGLTRGLTMAPDGTILTWNDSVGPYKSNTALIPGNNTAPFTPWTQIMRGGTVGGSGTNFPSSWLQSPIGYIGQGCVEIATVANNSNFMLAMICGSAGHPITNLFKSTDGGATWNLTNFPTNSLNSNGTQSGHSAQIICIDPNNNNNFWVTGDTNVQVTLDGGATWNTCASLPTAQCFAMAFDPTTPNRLIVGSWGNGFYVSTNANLGTSATFTHITSSITSPGEGRFGSDGVYYCTDGTTPSANGIYRIIGTTWVQITTASGVFSVAIDPNNPARVATWSSGNSSLGGQGVLIMNASGSPANTGSPTFVGPTSKSMGSTPDAPHVGNSFNNVNGSGPNGNTTMTNGNGLWFDPWKTTSSTTINLSALTAGGSTGNITVPANIPNITVGRQLRCTNTGTPGNYFIFNVTSYSGTTLAGTIISSAQGFYLGGPIGGTASASAWTISAERVYMNSGPGGGPSYVDGFTSGTQAVGSCTFGLEGSSVYDIIWPVGGNPVFVTQDRGIFPVARNPWNATSGVVDCWGFGAYNGLFQATTLAVHPTNPAFFITGGFSGFLKTTTGPNNNQWSAPANQPSGNTGVVACANTNVFVSAGGPGSTGQGIYYTQNGGSSAWSTMPSPAPTSSWCWQAPFITSHSLDFDTTTTGPFIFYGANFGDGFVYQFSVPASGTPTVTKKGAPFNTTNEVPGPGLALKCVPGHAGHLFFSAGEVDNSSTLSQIFSTHPNGASAPGNFTCLQFSSNQGGTFTPLTTSTQEVITFGLGAPSTDAGTSGYPTIFAVGWCGGGQYGLYKCINFNPASLGSETWTLLSNYIGTYGIGLPVCVAGDPNQEGRCIVGINGNGAAIFQEAGKTNGWF